MTREPLPKSAVMDGFIYPIDADFRLMIDFEITCQGEHEKKEERLQNIIKAFFGGTPKNMEKATDQLLWFYRCGKEIKPNQNDENQGKQKRIYAFDEDWFFIYAAFLDQYHLDLENIDFLHWWTFRGLFSALRDEHEFVKIMGYRGIKLTNDMSKDQRSFYKKMKHWYKLKDHRSVEEREQDFSQSFSALF